MSYQAQFQKAIETRHVLLPNEPVHPAIRNQPNNPETERVLFEFGSLFLDHIPPEDRVTKCHAVATSFKKFIESQDLPIDFGLSVTVGIVRLQGRSLFPCSVTSIQNLVEAGPDSDLPMNTHVWLTAGDSTVIDLNILAWLKAKLNVELAPGVSSPMIWRDRNASPLSYEPLLVDDDFMFRVDRVKAIRPLQPLA